MTFGVAATAKVAPATRLAKAFSSLILPDRVNQMRSLNLCDFLTSVDDSAIQPLLEYQYLCLEVVECTEQQPCDGDCWFEKRCVKKERQEVGVSSHRKFNRRVRDARAFLGIRSSNM